MTTPQRPLGLNKRPVGVFALQSAPEISNESVTHAIMPKTAPPKETPVQPLAATETSQATDDQEPLTVRVGLYLSPEVADKAQEAMAEFGGRNAKAIRRRGARRNSLNAFLTAVLAHALDNLDEVDPAEIVSRMPKGGVKR